jgi:subtilisin family serine protease
MPAPRNRKHLLVRAEPKAEAYTPHERRFVLPPVQGPKNRRRHAEALKAALERAEREAKKRREAVAITVHGAQVGLYIVFESAPGVELNLQSLEDRGKGIELVAVEPVSRGEEAPVQRATVFVPEGLLKHFVTRFEQYATEKTKKGEPRHKDSLDRIAALRRATLRALWTDTQDVYPAEHETIWWEVWLRRDEGRELERLLDFSAQLRLTVGERRIAFDDRTVVLVRASASQLSDSLDVLSDVAEVRRAKETAALFVDASPEKQAEWVKDLKRRTSPPPADAPAVCVLDTGVTRGHPLLEDAIAPGDVTAVDPTWGTADDGGGSHCAGHGTQMAGLVLYGDLVPHLASSAPVLLRHRVESVKILPPASKGTNDPALYGAITAEAVARPEVTAPRRRRSFSLAVTTKDNRDAGEPTSWSAALDALAVGRSFDVSTHGLVYLDQAEPRARRLFVVTAGNVDESKLEAGHLERSDVEPVHDPAQAWNVLTVGAFTEKAVIHDPDLDGWFALARPGELSPWSTTSVAFAPIWPIKPDLVFEGGNVGINGASIDFPIPELCLLSTYFRPAAKPLVLSWATSAAAAQVARMAALVQAEYPEFWPETIRALLVQASRWTRVMDDRLADKTRRREREALVRRYGFGVPSLDRVLRSADDALTLVVQSTIHPFSEGKMREMHLHRLSWPKDVLEELGSTPVRLRVTLSYFIEPNPGRRGWKRRHRYASHGLRFDVKSPTESMTEFRKRLNQRALEEEEEKPTSGGASEGWFLGEQARNKGSIHSDVWLGTAAELAARSVIGVYPVSGWWKDQPKRDRSAHGAHYALVASIETDAENVDIWTPVAQEIGVPLEIAPEA